MQTVVLPWDTPSPWKNVWPQATIKEEDAQKKCPWEGKEGVKSHGKRGLRAELNLSHSFKPQVAQFYKKPN